MAKWINIYDEGYEKLDYRIPDKERKIYLPKTEDGKENFLDLTVQEFDLLYKMSRDLEFKE